MRLIKIKKIIVLTILIITSIIYLALLFTIPMKDYFVTGAQIDNFWIEIIKDIAGLFALYGFCSITYQRIFYKDE